MSRPRRTPVERRIQQMQKIFGENLRETRLTAGLTLKQVSARSGISQNLWSAVEEGKEHLSLAVIIQMATAVGIDFTHLLKEREGDKIRAPARYASFKPGDPEGKLRLAIAANLRQARAAAALSRPELTAVSGVSTDYIQKLEEGAQNATIRILMQLARALGTTVRDLLPP